MIAIQEINLAVIKQQLVRITKQRQSRLKSISEKSCRYENLKFLRLSLLNTQSLKISQYHHNNIHKVNVLNDALCLFTSISESLAAIMCITEKVSSGLSLVLYGLGVTIYIYFLEVKIHHELRFMADSGVTSTTSI